MKTAIKVINDRVKILEDYLTKTKDDDSNQVRINRAQSESVKNNFLSLLESISSYREFLKSGVNNEDLAEKITELSSSTMIPLVERNKQILDSYKQMQYSFYERAKELEEKCSGVLENLSPEERKDLNYFNSMAFEYDKAKKDVVDYLYEYEIALEEIKELVISGEVESIAEIIEDRGQSAPVEQEEPVDAETPLHKEEVHSDEDADKIASQHMKDLFKKNSSAPQATGNNNHREEGNEQFPT